MLTVIPALQVSYHDFEVTVVRSAGGHYTVSATGAGSTSITVTRQWPFNEATLAQRLAEFDQSLRSEPGQANHRAEDIVRRFGQQLFEMLFPGDVHDAYSANCDYARDKGLRLKLRLPAPELAVLPWEFMYDPDDAEYLSLKPNFSVVRYTRPANVTLPLSLTPPLRILGVVASPEGLPPLDIDQERHRLERTLDKLRQQGLVNLYWLTSATWGELLEVLPADQWHVLHFVGYTGTDPLREIGGYISLVNESDHRSYPRYTDRLTTLLQNHPSLRLMVLNAYNAHGVRDDGLSNTALAIAHQLPAALALPAPVNPKATELFTRKFYEALVDGLPIDTATTIARRRILLELDGFEWGTPALFTSATEGVLFKVQDQQTRLAEERAEAEKIAAQKNQEAEAARDAPQRAQLEEERDKAIQRAEQKAAAEQIIINITAQGDVSIGEFVGRNKQVAQEQTTVTVEPNVVEAERLNREQAERERRERARIESEQREQQRLKHERQTQIIIAIIGLVGTVLAALLVSPWWLPIFQSAPTATSTLTATPTRPPTTIPPSVTPTHSAPAPTRAPTRTFTPSPPTPTRPTATFTLTSVTPIPTINVARFETLKILVHPLPVRGVAWSPNGQILATGDNNQLIHLWDTTAWVQNKNSDDRVGSAAVSIRGLGWSPDGQWLAWGRGDGEVKLWNPTGADAPRVLRENFIYPVGSLAWSASGRLASSYEDGVIIVWDLETGQPAQRFDTASDNGQTTDEAVWGLAWSPDEQYIASGHADRRIQIMDVSTGEPLQSRQSANVVYTVAWSPDGQWLAVGNISGQVEIWDTTTWKLNLSLSGEGFIRDVAWSPDGSKIAAGSSTGVIFIWEVATGNELITLTDHTHQVYDLDWSPDGKQLASASLDTTVRIWGVPAP